jgi:hypothetical protein
MGHHDTPITDRHTGRAPSRLCLRRIVLGPSGFAAIVILISWIVFGSIILLGSIGVLEVGIGELWPVILILVGANLLLAGGRYRLRSDRHHPGTESNPVARVAKGARE